MDVKPPDRSVSWLAVTGGLFLAWFTGIFVNIFAIAGSLFLLDQESQKVPAVAVAVVGVALVYYVLFWLMRRRWRDFAMGILVGGCMMALIAGACGAVMSGALG